MRTEKKESKKAKDLTEEETKRIRRYLTKHSIEIKAPDHILKGKEAIKRKPIGKEIKGGLNWRLSSKDPLIGK